MTCLEFAGHGLEVAAVTLEQFRIGSNFEYRLAFWGIEGLLHKKDLAIKKRGLIGVRRPVWFFGRLRLLDSIDCQRPKLI